MTTVTTATTATTDSTATTIHSTHLKKHWKLNVDSEGIAWLQFDRANKPVNTFNPEVFREFSDILDSLVNSGTCYALVISSAKSSGFIAGADVDYIASMNTDIAVTHFIQQGQTVFNKLMSLPFPTVALIKGYCMGGGLEMSLACTYRIVEEGSATRLGLPEVKLGIIPGWGGSVRLPRLIGAIPALYMMISTKTVDAKTAVSLGLADVCVPERQLMAAAHHYAINHPRRHHPRLLQRLSNMAWFRPVIASIVRRQVKKKVREAHYPAPFVLLDIWQRYGVDEKDGLLAEVNAISQLITNDTTKNLVRIFSLQEKLKRSGKQIDFTPTRIHVIGAGVMGGDIAAWCAFKGYNVTLQDREPALIAPAIKRAFDLYKKKFKSRRDIQAALDRLIPDVEGIGISTADVIIEAVYENLEAKQAIFKDVEKRAKPDAILATNTSSIPLDEINTVLSSPERLVGVHFFNPVSMMPLVEIVKGKMTNDTVFDKAKAFVRELDKLPLPVKSSPGFLVNRILTPYLFESMAMLKEGFSIGTIDEAAESFGMPMGPIELADTVGLDVCLSVGDMLAKKLSLTIPDQLRDKVAKKELGRKTGKGFYTFNKKGKPIREKNKEEVSSATINQLADRLILKMIEEAVLCLKEQIVTDSDFLDAGMIFGTGFAPFRGGPIHYAEAKGMPQVGFLKQPHKAG
jgi:3-hydroxyacyl-CoA dehydrogenase / enoyl-CoA hydratase / 3-hydroxybutyryl-CoA epimerase